MLQYELVRTILSKSAMEVELMSAEPHKQCHGQCSQLNSANRGAPLCWFPGMRVALLYAPPFDTLINHYYY